VTFQPAKGEEYSGGAYRRLGYGHDHRGATFYDEDEAVIWLVAYGRHRSGAPDDFFPCCKKLDAEGRLLPGQADIARMYRDRDIRFVEAVTIEAPQALNAARETEGEYRCTIGGELGAGLAIEVVEELEATSITVAFKPAGGGPLTKVTLEQGRFCCNPSCAVSGRWSAECRRAIWSRTRWLSRSRWWLARLRRTWIFSARTSARSRLAFNITTVRAECQPGRY